MIRKWVIAVVSVVWLAVGGASVTLAQSPAPSANDPATLSEARRLLAVTNTSQLVDQMAGAQLQMMVNVIAKANPGMEVTVKQILEEVFMPEFRNTMPELLEEMAHLYAVHFTADELHALNVFYESPIGVKTINTMPQLMQQSMQLGQVWGQKVAQDALAKAAPKLRERGINL